ncbi:FHA domain-containing protein [Nocardioides coralli]|uniref:FHA domain-containing protein n=1 Tax=Nocardioides coralli TaxID=2872154 RepID=UPI001CA40D72|nr:FHA domain-containing protein [Nocardioides coralli]QZY30559.1 FHA domain-containing protein [Nocardioides coralli]
MEADLCFQVDVDGRPPVTGSLTGSGSDLTLAVSDPAAFAGGSDAESLRRVADELADLGLRVRVTDRGGRSLLRMGDVRTPWWQRPVTRSAHLRVAGVRGLLAAGRGRARDAGGALPGGGLTPPSTPYPVAPTFLRRPVKRVTTTHDPGRGGGPRLVEVPMTDVARSDHPVHWLQSEVTTIGSDPACDVVLPGLAARHAEVRHDADDEFVLVALHPDVRVHGERIRERVLRTGSRVDLGVRQLVFSREEYADHGRPYGGRIGGELGFQRPQPPRHALREDRPTGSAD